MKLSKLRETLLLIVPILAFVGWGTYLQQPRGDGSLKLVRTGVKQLPNHITEINFVVKYDSPSPLPEFVTRPRIGGTFLGVYDEKGNRVELGFSGMGCGPIGNYLYSFKCQFPVDRIPKSVRRINAKCQANVGDASLPLAKALKH